MNYRHFKDFCLALKYDIDFDEFKTLASNRYTEQYLKSIWDIYCLKPLEFVLYHDFGKEIFNFIKHKESISEHTFQP